MQKLHLAPPMQDEEARTISSKQENNGDVDPAPSRKEEQRLFMTAAVTVDDSTGKASLSPSSLQDVGGEAIITPHIRTWNIQNTANRDDAEDGQEMSNNRSTKKRKILSAFGILLVGIVVIVVVLLSGSSDETMASNMISTLPCTGVQFGSALDGEAGGDWFGHSVSLSSDGNRVAVGAPWNDDNGLNAGHVRISDWSGSAWIQTGSDLDGEADGDWFGHSVSLSSDGNRVAVGAPWNDGNGEEAGHVRIFDWSGNAWIQLGSELDGEAADDWFGYSVSLSSDGNRVAVGAGLNDHNGTKVGHVQIFDWSGSAWIQLGSDLDGEAAHDQFGWSISLSSDGNRVAVGALLNDGNGVDAGHVRIFDWSGSAWIQLGSDLDGEAVGDHFGWSISLSSDGNRVAVGAPYNDRNGVEAGHVRIFDWSGSAWIRLGSDLDGEAGGDWFGYSVSLASDGNRVAVGAPYNDHNGTKVGHVRIFDWSGSAWIQLGSKLDGEAADDWFGYSVSLATEGNRVAVGAPYNDDNGVDAGHVHIFHLEDASCVG